jgi:hypothetical protein
LSPSGTFANFRRISHSLFALLFGWIGAVIARWLWARRMRAENSPSATESPIAL